METAYYIVSIIGIVFDAVLAGVAISVSIRAIKQTKIQIELSNKQQLFDRRLEKYTTIQDIISCYSNTQPAITQKDVNISDYREVILIIMLNNPLLKASIKAVDDPMDAESREVFYDKIRKLKQLSEETKIIFDNKEAILVSAFIMQFREFLEYLFFEHYYSVYKEQKEMKRKFGFADEDDESFFLFERKKSIDVLPELQKIYKTIIETNATNTLLEQVKLK